MKTKVISIFSALAVVVLIASCSKAPNKVLVKKDGKWNAYNTITTTVGSSSTTNKDTTVITFVKDGSGTMTSGGTTQNFTWTYDKKDKKMEITTTSGGTSTITDFVVSDLKSKSETWTYDDTQTISGITFSTHEVINLVRVD